MQLAILHHHLNSGGVTRVIENHLRALASVTGPSTALPQRVLLLHGGRAENLPTVPEGPVVVPVAVAGLDYDAPTAVPSSALGNNIAQALADQGCTPANTLLHWHNHGLGKNVSTPGAVAQLARQGYRMLLQVHDFAEDLRPDNYRKLATALAPASGSSGGPAPGSNGGPSPTEATGAADGECQAGQQARLAAVADQLYPQAQQIHYATLNQRDHRVLATAGISPSRLHLLPNPAQAPTSDAAGDDVRQAWGLPADMPLVIYPVRGIRRKNLGEFLLWSAVHPEAFFHLTLAPESPVEKKAFDQWPAYAQQFELHCSLGQSQQPVGNVDVPTNSSVQQEPAHDHRTPAPVPAGGRLCRPPVAFDALLRDSDALLTTSVAEGFGMVFLEAWLVGKPLLGRNLPEISADFCEAGLNLDGLYTTLDIPTAWLEAGAFTQAWEKMVARLFHDFGQPAPHPTELRQQLIAALAQPTIDFARLPVGEQRRVIERACRHADDRQTLLELNPRLQLPGGDTARLVAANAQVVRDHFSLPRLGQQLAQVYATVWQSSPQPTCTPLPQGGAVLASFLQLERLHPVRVTTS